MCALVPGSPVTTPSLQRAPSGSAAGEEIAMTVPSPARRASALQASALVTGYLVVMSFAMVGAWPTTVLLGAPVLVAAVIAPRARRAAGVLAAVPALVVVVWWVAYNIGRGFR